MDQSKEHQRILEAMTFRHACKRFDAEKSIPQQDVDTILEAARLSPTSFGFEPWKMIILADEALKKQLYPLAWGCAKQS